jgi:hypothetical protein
VEDDEWRSDVRENKLILATNKVILGVKGHFKANSFFIVQINSYRVNTVASSFPLHSIQRCVTNEERTNTPTPMK